VYIKEHVQDQNQDDSPIKHAKAVKMFMYIEGSSVAGDSTEKHNLYP
jgi:hypothetical protein